MNKADPNSRLDGLLLTVAVPFRLILYIARILLFAVPRGYRVKYYVMCAAINMAFVTLGERVIQARLPTTTESYHNWLRSIRKRVRDPALTPLIQDEMQPLNETGGRLLWIGNRRKATRFVLFFHGGGFVAPALRGHFEWCWNAYVMAGREAGVDVAVCFLHYTLLPEGRFPVPLQQAAAALGELLDSGVSPSDIIIGGDSAGGNLTAQVLGHILHPHDGVRRIQLQEPLSGVFLVSPWLSNNFHTESFTTNDGRDMISRAAFRSLSYPMYGDEAAKVLEASSRAGKYSTTGNSHMTPLDAGDAWFDGLDGIADSLYLTAGKNEIMLDHSVSLANILKKQDFKSPLRFEVAEREAHDFILLEGEENHMGDATMRMKNWFKTVI